MNKSFLQTIEWLKFQESMGHKTWRFDDGAFKANIIKIDIPFGKNYLYVPHGPELDFDSIKSGLENEVRKFTGQLKLLAKENKSMFVKVEPLADSIMEILFPHGFKISRKNIQPKKTVILDLDKSEEELLSDMHHKTRYNIKVAEKHNIILEPISDFEAFWSLLNKTANRQKFSTHPKKYYKKMLDFFNKDGDIKTQLFSAMFEGRPIAGALMLTYKDTAHYLHGGSDYDHRQLMAPYAMHWGLIQEMKRQGFRYYDFGGSEGDKWPSLTRFKLGFGGQVTEYPGSFDLPISKFWYFVYKVFQKIR